MDDDHLVGGRSGAWSWWRCVCLRGAGFPARLVLALGDPKLARAVDVFHDAEASATAARDALLAQLRGDHRDLASEHLAALRRARKAVEKGKVPAAADLAGLGAVTDAPLAAMQAAVRSVENARREVDTMLEQARKRDSRVLRGLAHDERFREAVTWQNRQGVHTALDSLCRKPLDEEVRTRDRQHEEMVANYLQRYCTKNDTIGFFGPWGWAELSDQGATVEMSIGAQLVEKRGVYFEQWTIDALADVIAKEEGIHAWTAPRRFAFVRVHDGVAYSPTTPERALSRAEELVLAACDGASLPAELAASLVAEHGDVFELETDVDDALHALVAAQLIAWTFAVPLRFEPDALLRARIARIGDEDLRARALEPLERLEAARSAVAAAAGDTATLDTAMAGLDAAFTSLTGRAPSRHAGSTYGARGLVFEDAVRDTRLVLGPAVLEAVDAPLALLLTSCRWLTHETARVYREALRGLHGELASSSGGALPFIDFWIRAQRLLYGSKGTRPVDLVVAELEERWTRVLRIDDSQRRVTFTSAELAPAVEAAFAAPGPGWPSARHHSPDLMIAAESAQAMAEGRFEVVLGELHVALPSIDGASCVHHHPDPGALASWLARDVPEPRFLTVPSKASPQALVRTLSAIVNPADRWLETGVDEAPSARAQALAGADLTVHVDGERIFVRGGDLAAGGVDLVELLAQELSNLVAQRFRMHRRAESHMPRVTIDRLVVARETWRFAPADMAFARLGDADARFVAARAWARRLGLPRFVFGKTSVEVKPFYVDLESPVLVDMLAKMVRKAQDHVAGDATVMISEMLPALDQLWLPDAAGELYACELRCTVVDTASPATGEGSS